jgi:TonB-linked SusC/RagA family outer membrane protein
MTRTVLSASPPTHLTINNPLSIVGGASSKNVTVRTLGNLFIEYELIDGLKAKLNLGADLQNLRRDIYNTRLTIRGYAQNGMANISTLERTDVLGEYTMDYRKQVTPKNLIGILGGVTYQYFNTRKFAGSINNFPSDNLQTDNLGLGDIVTASLASNREKNALLSYLGRVNYTYSDKYLLTASIRADGSSRFGTNNKFGYFPSFAGGWNLSNETFIPKFFNNLKLRASWGVTGNQDIGNYRSLSTYTKGATFVSGSSISVGTSPSRIANPDLKWESTTQTDVGIDAVIFKGRLNITFDYFLKSTHDMLIDLPLPRATGYTSILSNIGSLQNRGVEVYLTAAIIDRRHFQWRSSVNLATVKNKVTDLGDVKEILAGNASNIGNTVIIAEGKPAFAYYGYKVTGIFKNTEEVAASSQPNSKPGFPIYEDLNKDGQINASDQQIIGDPYPDFTYGWQNSFTYKRFSFSFLLQGQQGGETFNGNIMESMYPSNYRRNMLTATVSDRWTEGYPDGKWPSGAEPTSYGGGKVNTLALQDVSYLRLKYAQLAYNIPVNRKHISAASIYISGQNIFTLSDYIGYDPEANTFGNSSARVDLNTYPLARTWSVGLNLSF